MYLRIKMGSRLLAFAFLLLAFGAIAVSAEPLELVVIPIDNEVAWNETATYTIKILNAPSGHSFSLRPASYTWGIVSFGDANIITNGIINVDATLSPPRDVRIGTYAVEIQAISNKDPSIRASAFLKIVVTSELPKIEPEWGIPKQLNPGETKVNLILKNTGSTAVSGLTAVLTSTLLPQPVTFDVGTLQKGEAKLIWDTILNLPLNTEAKEYTFNIQILKDGEEVGKQTYAVTVLPKPSVEVSVSKDEGFLTTAYAVVVTNIGNTRATGVYSDTLPSWKSIFLFSKLKPDFATGAYAGSVSASWPYDLEVGQSTIITYKISYIPLLALLLALLVLGYAGSWIFQQEVRLTKMVEAAGKALKVKLLVKNATRKPVRAVVVTDEIPTPLKLMREFGGEKPAAIKQSSGAIKLLWKFDTLWPGEEKQLSYNVKSALGVVGTLILPPAKGKRKAVAKDEKPKIYISNAVAVKGNIAVIEDEEKPAE